MSPGRFYMHWNPWETLVCPRQPSLLCLTAVRSASQRRLSWDLLPFRPSDASPAQLMWVNADAALFLNGGAIIICSQMTQMYPIIQAECFNEMVIDSWWLEVEVKRWAGVLTAVSFPQRSVLLQLYSSSPEDPEVRIAAYQQLLRCPDQDVFEVVKATLRTETSSQGLTQTAVKLQTNHWISDHVLCLNPLCRPFLSSLFSSFVWYFKLLLFLFLVGSFVWSHLTNVLRSEDPMKQALIESLPDDIISRDFEAEFLKYSSYSDYTAASGDDRFKWRKWSKIAIRIIMLTFIYTPIKQREGIICNTTIFCVCFRHGNHKFGKIFDFLSQIVSPEICHHQPHSVFSRSSPQPYGSEFSFSFH